MRRREVKPRDVAQGRSRRARRMGGGAVAGRGKPASVGVAHAAQSSTDAVIDEGSRE